MSAALAQAEGRVRLFVGADLGEGRSLALTEGQAHYLANVMRLASGDAVRVFNGRDGEWLARIERMQRAAAALTVERRLRAQEAEAGPWLIFAPVKKSATDYIVEKATELGAGRIWPVMTERTIAARVATGANAGHRRRGGGTMRAVDGAGDRRAFYAFPTGCRLAAGTRAAPGASAGQRASRARRRSHVRACVVRAGLAPARSRASGWTGGRTDPPARLMFSPACPVLRSFTSVLVRFGPRRQWRRFSPAGSAWPVTGEMAGPRRDVEREPGPPRMATDPLHATRSGRHRQASARRVHGGRMQAGGGVADRNRA